MMKGIRINLATAGMIVVVSAAILALKGLESMLPDAERHPEASATDWCTIVAFVLGVAFAAIRPLLRPTLPHGVAARKKLPCAAAESPSHGNAKSTASMTPVAKEARAQEADAEPTFEMDFTSAVRARTRTGDLRGAVALLERALKSGRQPELLAYSAVIVAASRACKPRLAERLLLRMVSDGIQPDAVSFHAAVNAQAKGEEIDAAAAERIVLLMCEHGVEPDVVTLGAAVHACARVGDRVRAEDIFKRVVARGRVEPDAICYNALINAAVKANDIVAAEEWLSTMLRHGIAPSVVSFTTVLHGFARIGNVVAAERGLQLMQEHGVTANVVSYNALLHACGKLADVERAEKWFDHMRRAGVQATVVSYSTMLDVCAKAGDWQRAERWLAAMGADGVAPNVVSFNNVIDACSKASKPSRAEAWLRRLLREPELPGASKLPDVWVPHGVFASRQSWTAAASAFASLGYYADTERVLADMEDYGLEVDAFGLTVLLSAYARARPRQADRAEQAFRDHVRRGRCLTDPPLRVLRTCLGLPRWTQLLEELDVKQPVGM